MPKQNRVTFLAFKYRSRGRDVMPHLIMYSRVGRTIRGCTLFLLLIWDRYYRLRRSTPTKLLHFTSNLFTSKSCDTFLYFVITLSIPYVFLRTGDRMLPSLHSFKSFEVRQEKHVDSLFLINQKNTRDFHN